MSTGAWGKALAWLTAAVAAAACVVAIHYASGRWQDPGRGRALRAVTEAHQPAPPPWREAARRPYAGRTLTTDAEFAVAPAGSWELRVTHVLRLEPGDPVLAAIRQGRAA